MDQPDLRSIFKRQTSGSVACPSCNQLVGVNEKVCPHCGRINPGIWGYARMVQKLGSDLGFLSIVTWGCLVLYLATLLVDFGNIHIGGGMEILSPSTRSLVLFGASGAIPIFTFGRWWTILSAAWLHGGLFHVGFNLAWIRYLGPTVAELYKGSRLIIIYTVAAMTGSILSSLAAVYLTSLPEIFHGANLSVGASGGVFGLFGALVSYGQITKNNAIKQTAFNYALVCFILGVIMPRVDNWGHLGGFIGGYAITKLPWFHPFYRDGHWHFIGAIACLIATVLSIFASLVHGLLFFSAAVL